MNDIYVGPTSWRSWRSDGRVCLKWLTPPILASITLEGYGQAKWLVYALAAGCEGLSPTSVSNLSWGSCRGILFGDVLIRSNTGHDSCRGLWPVNHFVRRDYVRSFCLSEGFWSKWDPTPETFFSGGFHPGRFCQGNYVKKFCSREFCPCSSLTGIRTGCRSWGSNGNVGLQRFTATRLIDRRDSEQIVTQRGVPQPMDGDAPRVPVVNKHTVGLGFILNGLFVFIL